MRFIAPAMLLWAMGTSGPTFTVEDESLIPVPKEVVAGISEFEKKAPNDGERPCSFIGKQVALREGGRGIDWVVTTANACSWAASAAPVWVLIQSPDGRYRVVLSFVTYDLTVGRGSQNGLHHIATARGTAARQEEQLWKFDGETYRLSKLKVHEGNP